MTVIRKCFSAFRSARCLNHYRSDYWMDLSLTSVVARLYFLSSIATDVLATFLHVTEMLDAKLAAILMPWRDRPWL